MLKVKQQMLRKIAGTWFHLSFILKSLSKHGAYIMLKCDQSHVN